MIQGKAFYFCIHGLLLGITALVSCAGSRSPFKGWTFPLTPGESVLRCYSRLRASEIEIDSALQKLWLNYPANRITNEDLRKIRRAFNPSPDSINHATGKVITERDAFKHQRKEPYKEVRYTWGIKSAKGKVIFSLDIANCASLGNTSNCDLCLVSALFIPIAKPAGNSQLSRQERADAEIWFEEDIMMKLRELILEARRNSHNSKD